MFYHATYRYLISPVPPPGWHDGDSGSRFMQVPSMASWDSIRQQDPMDNHFSTTLVFSPMKRYVRWEMIVARSEWSVDQVLCWIVQVCQSTDGRHWFGPHKTVAPRVASGDLLGVSYIQACLGGLVGHHGCLDDILLLQQPLHLLSRDTSSRAILWQQVY